MVEEDSSFAVLPTIVGGVMRMTKSVHAIRQQNSRLSTTLTAESVTFEDFFPVNHRKGYPYEEAFEDEGEEEEDAVCVYSLDWQWGRAVSKDKESVAVPFQRHLRKGHRVIHEVTQQFEQYKKELLQQLEAIYMEEQRRDAEADFVFDYNASSAGSRCTLGAIYATSSEGPSRLREKTRQVKAKDETQI